MENSYRASQLPTPIGTMTLVSNGEALISASYHGLDEIRDRGVVLGGSDDVIETAKQELTRYFGGEKVAFSVPIAPRGTDFQREVWSALKEIPYGELSTYGTIAERVGNKKGVRAVGGAIGRNPLVVIVPCHRIVGSDGTLTGFSAGIDRKIYLLNRESPDAVQSAGSNRLARVSLPAITPLL